MYWSGLGVATDKVEAVKWYRKAADQGLPNAQFNLSLVLMKGEGVRQNTAEGRKWLQRAANQGFVPAIELQRKLFQGSN